MQNFKREKNSIGTHYLPLNLFLCVCIVMLVTWHADPQTFFKKVYLLIKVSCRPPLAGYVTDLRQN